MKENKKILVLMGSLLLASVVAIPLTTNALNPKYLTGSITGSIRAESSIKADSSLNSTNSIKSEQISVNKKTTTYSAELVEAYERAYANGIIFESPIDNATLYEALPNPSMRTILLRFANYLGIDSVSTMEIFGHMFDDEGSSANYASFSKSLAKILWGYGYGGKNASSQYYLNALKYAGIVGQNVNLEDPVMEGNALLTLMRSVELYNSDIVNCDDAVVQLACLDPNLESAYEQCPEECRYGTLKNNLKKTVEFKANEVGRKVVFNGTYTALKDHSIGGITMWLNGYYGDCNNIIYNNMTFYVYIDGEEVESYTGNLVGRPCLLNSYIKFNDIDINKGESVQVKIEGELNSTRYKEESYSFKINLENDEKILAVEKLAPIKIVSGSSDFLIDTAQEKQTVHLKGRNLKVAEFIIKPSKGNSAHLDELVLKIDQARIKADDIELKIDGAEYEYTSSNDGDMHITCQPDIEIPSEGVPVQIVLRHEPEYEDYTIGTELESINGKATNKSFSKRFVSVLVYISKQENKGDYTEFTLGVDKYDDNYLITSVCMLTGSTGAGTCLLGKNSDNGPFEDGFTFDVYNSDQAEPINYITYFIKNPERPSWADSISLEKKDYPDYFKVNGTAWRIYSNDELVRPNTGKITQVEQTIDKNVALNRDLSLNEKTSSTKSQKSYSEEMVAAYQFAYENGITTASTIDGAKMYSPLTRGAMAKMLANYAINVLGMEPDVSKPVPQFRDVTSKINQQYDNGIILAYQLGILGQNIKSGNFRPYDLVTRAEFVTALSRMLYGTEDGSPYYITHFEKLKAEGIINSTGNPTSDLLRGYAMLMFMRSAQ